MPRFESELAHYPGAVKTLLWLLDEALDRVPRREEGRWYRFGDWGCQLQLARYWASEDERP